MIVWWALGLWIIFWLGMVIYMVCMDGWAKDLPPAKGK